MVINEINYVIEMIKNEYDRDIQRLSIEEISELRRKIIASMKNEDVWAKGLLTNEDREMHIMNSTHYAELIDGIDKYCKLINKYGIMQCNK